MNRQRTNTTKHVETPVLGDTHAVLRGELSRVLASAPQAGDLALHLPPPAGGRGEGRCPCWGGSPGAGAGLCSGLTRTPGPQPRLERCLSKLNASQCKTEQPLPGQQPRRETEYILNQRTKLSDLFQPLG